MPHHTHPLPLYPPGASWQGVCTVKWGRSQGASHCQNGASLLLKNGNTIPSTLFQFLVAALQAERPPLLWLGSGLVF